MTQNNKKTLMYAGAIVLVSGIVYAIYSAKKNQLALVDNARVNTNEETAIPEVTKTNPFTSLVKNPLPSSIDWKPSDFSQYFNTNDIK